MVLMEQTGKMRQISQVKKLAEARLAAGTANRAMQDSYAEAQVCNFTPVCDHFAFGEPYRRQAEEKENIFRLPVGKTVRGPLQNCLLAASETWDSD